MRLHREGDRGSPLRQATKRLRNLLALLLVLIVTSCSGSNVPVIGVLEDTVATPKSETYIALVQALRNGGYRGGDNVRYQRRNAESRKEPLPALAADLTRNERPVLVVVFSEQGLDAVLAADPQAPVLLALSGEGAGNSAARYVMEHKGLYGAAQPSMGEQAIAYVHEALPQVMSIGILVDPANAESRLAAENATRAAAKLGLVVHVAEVADPTEAQSKTLRLLGQHSGVIILTPSHSLEMGLPDIIRIANIPGVPVIAARTRPATKGALASFQPDPRALGKAAGELGAMALNGQIRGSNLIVSSDFLRLTVDPVVAAKFGLTVP